jgi:hypothetical protein
MGAHAVGGGFGGRGFGGRGFGSFAFSGGPAYAYGDYYGDYSCWQWYPGRYGYVRVWVC